MRAMPGRFKYRSDPSDPSDPSYSVKLAPSSKNLYNKSLTYPSLFVNKGKAEIL